MPRSPARVVLSFFLAGIPAGAQTTPVASAINTLGLELFRAHETDPAAPANLLLSPCSVEVALALAYVGADGVTRDEMRRVLHLPANEEEAVAGFAALRNQLQQLQARSKERAEQDRQGGSGRDFIELNIANRLFAQSGFSFQEEFLETLRRDFDAPLAQVDFVRAAGKAREEINAWVSDQTRERIRDLIPGGALDSSTRAVLANALYLRAPWEKPFETSATRPETFWAGGTEPVEVPTMVQQETFGYRRQAGFTALTLPYDGGQLQCVVLLPEKRDGLAALQEALTATDLAACANQPRREVRLRLPKFRLEPPMLALGKALRELGMKSAFDDPPGSADFDRMAQRRGDDALAISEVFHKSWLVLDEKGTEAAAATAVAMRLTAAPIEPRQPVEVRVEHPFLVAIQHVPSGACLFLGRVVDPR